MTDQTHELFSDDEWEACKEEAVERPSMDGQVREILQALWEREATGVADEALVVCTQSMRRYFRRTVAKE